MIRNCLRFTAVLFAGVLGLATLAWADTLTVYSSGPRSLAGQLAAAFEKATGHKVELWASSTGKVLARLEAERANPRADVVILANQSAGLALQSQGLLERYRPEALVERMREGLAPPSDFIPMGADIVTMVVNSGHLPQGKRPADWSDLLDPAYRGQVSMPNPLLSGTAAEFVLGFLQVNGDEGWTFFEKLKANGAIWPGPNAAALAPVKLGARSVLMAGVGHTSLKAKKEGNSLDLILPSSGSIMIPRPIAILKSSRHKDTAKKFVDFVLSDVGQELVAKSLLIPALKSVKPDPIWPDLDNAHFWSVDWQKMADDRSSVLNRFDARIIR